MLSLTEAPKCPKKANFLRRVNRMNREDSWLHEGQPISLKAFFKDKFRAHQYIRGTSNVTMPSLLMGPTRHENVKLPRDLSEFVVKPNAGVGSKGVMVLERNGNSPTTFRELIRNEQLSEAEVYQRMKAWSEKRPAFSDWIIEERVSDPDVHPYVIDYKFYTFKTGAPLCLVKYSHRGTYAWVDSGGHAIETGRYVRKLETAPHHSADLPNMFRLATQIQQHIPSPFCRIDLYSTHAGPVLGEVTPVPGDPKSVFNDKWEHQLNSQLDRSHDLIRSQLEQSC